MIFIELDENQIDSIAGKYIKNWPWKQLNSFTLCTEVVLEMQTESIANSVLSLSGLALSK
jgi:hypothetical protein